MALSAPSESPAVVVREIDLTGGVPNVQSTTGAIVGNFRWGPVLQRKLISNEAELVSTFGTPSDATAVDFLSAAQYLRYSSTLYVVRATDSNGSGVEPGAAYCMHDGSITTVFDVDNNPYFNNSEDFTNREASVTALEDSNNHGIQFIAKYPGDLGNSLKVAYLPSQSTGDSTWDAWTYKSSFDAKPTTSDWATSRNDSGDELHVAVIDEDGLFSGTRGTVLEVFPNLSVLLDAKDGQGQSIYAKEVINANSQYIYMLNFDSAQSAAGAGLSTFGTGRTYRPTVPSAVAKSLSNGTNSGSLGTSAGLAGYDLYEDKDQVEVDFIIAPQTSTTDGLATVVNDLVSTAQSTRKDCVVITSPNRASIVGVSSDATRVSNTVTAVSGLTRSSYLIVDNNYLKVYDKYNDKYVFIPAASTTAGIMAATDYNRAAWFSPAGSRRGQLLGVTALAYSPTKAQRDTLYKNGVNPIANIPGQGVLLFGDKTFLSRPSAFDRINVRRLFLILERAIGRAAEQVLFEFNDEFTRAEFVNIVEPVLREVQGRRGITDFRVVCDETNNTAAVIDRNEFIASVFIKPARSINYVTLNFVAVRTGVDFEEVVGTV